MNEIIHISEKTQIHIMENDCLNEQQIQNILHLVHICRMHDQISLTCPLAPEDEARHFLFYKKTGDRLYLSGVLSVLRYDAETAECYAFTHPEHRRQGCFSQLLDHALERIGDCDILFPVSGNCPDTLAVLETLGAELDSAELQMELDLSTKTNRSEPDLPLIQSRMDSQTALDEWTLYQDLSCKKALGSCQTSIVSDTSVCLHHVEILPEFRGCGYGSILMKNLIEALQNQGFARILLQVAGDNEAALALYKRQGFRITETLSFYLY